MFIQTGKQQQDQHGVNIMTILPSGQVQITNSQTGETKIVDPSALGGINPFLANQYNAALANQMAVQKANKASSATSAGNDILQPPPGAGTTTTTGAGGATTTSKKKTPNPASFQQSVPQVSIPQAPGMSQLTQGNQLAQQPQNNTPWIGSQITDMFKAPQLNVAAAPPGY